MRFLTCEPNLSKDPGYVDEADVFYQDPAEWLKRHFPRSQSAAPSHLVMFNVLQPALRPFFEKHGYVDCGTFFHSHVPEGRVGSHVYVACKIEWKISSDMSGAMRSKSLPTARRVEPKKSSVNNKEKATRAKESSSSSSRKVRKKS